MKAAILATVVAAMTGWMLPAVMGQSPTSKPAALMGDVNITGVGSGTYEELIKVCEFTPEQQKKILDIAALRAKVAKDVEEAVKAAKDRSSRNKASRPLYEVIAKSQGELDKTLTVEQKAKWQQYVILRTVKQTYSSAKLSDEQWNKIMDAYEKLAKDSSAKPCKIMNKLRAMIDAMLTPAQKAKMLLTTRYGQMSKVCKFTDEQIKRLVQIEDDRNKAQDNFGAKSAEIQKALQDANQSGDSDAIAKLRKQSAEISNTYRELNKKYDDEAQNVLTDQQKAAWQDEMKNQMDKMHKIPMVPEISSQ
jgi:Spy/CpxP family protein refolding chaperone